MGAWKRALLRGALGAVVVATPAAARADDGAASAFSRAISLAADDRCDAAVPLFLESHAMDPAVGALVGAADCLVRLDRLREALARYREAASLAREVGDERASDIERTAHAVEDRLPAASPPAQPEQPPRDPPQRKIGLAVGLVGIFGVTLGGGLLIMASIKRGDIVTRCGGNAGQCDPAQRSDVSGLERAADEETAAGVTALAVGGAALITGGVLFFTAPRVAPSVALGVAPRGAYLKGTF